MNLITTSNFKEHRIQLTTQIIGWSFIAMFIFGIIAEFFVRNQLINWDDSIITFNKIQKSIGLFETGIFLFILIIILDVVLSILFYSLLSTVDKLLALLMVSLRLIYVAVKAIAIVGLILARDLYSSFELHSQDIETAAIQGMQYLKLHHYGFSVGLIFFGLHLITLSILFFKIKGIPKILTGLLLIAGIGYILNSLTGFFANENEMLKMVVIILFIIPMSFSELFIAIWLWIKGKRILLQM